MADLLSRLLTLTGPDRAVDAEIALANGWIRVPDHIYWRNPDGQICHEPPRYTESLDAVEPLLAEFYYLLAKGRTRPDEPLYGVQILEPGTPPGTVLAEAEHEVAAIALLIAWQKAKEGSK